MSSKHNDTKKKGLNSQRGQSFLELALTLPILLLVLAGLVEVGFFINEYIDVIDATREAARFGTNLVYTDTGKYDNPADDCDPDEPDYAECLLDTSKDKGFCTNTTDPFQTTHFYYVVACLTQDNLQRIEALSLDLGQAHRGVKCDACTDDIVISIFSFDRSDDTPVVRLPDDNGWSYTRANKDADPASDDGPGCLGADVNNDGVIDSLDYCPSSLSASFVEDQLVDGAPNAGLVLVEVYYLHYQVLNLPFFNLIANPLRIHAYSFFPNPSAEPTATE